MGYYGGVGKGSEGGGGVSGFQQLLLHMMHVELRYTICVLYKLWSEQELHAIRREQVHRTILGAELEALARSMAETYGLDVGDAVGMARRHWRAVPGNFGEQVARVARVEAAEKRLGGGGGSGGGEGGEDREQCTGRGGGGDNGDNDGGDDVEKRGSGSRPGLGLRQEESEQSSALQYELGSVLTGLFAVPGMCFLKQQERGGSEVCGIFREHVMPFLDW